MDIYQQEGKSTDIGVVVPSLLDRDDSCLLMTSPCIKNGDVPLVFISGTRNVCSAYNYGWDLLKTKYVAFTHTDVYLPDGWEYQVLDQIKKVDAFDMYWGAIGPAGVMCRGDGKKLFSGHIQDRDLLRYTEGLPIEVYSLDEVMVIMRRSAMYVWDEKMPTYHLAATELCMRLRESGHRSYAIDAPIRHESKLSLVVPSEFDRSVGYLVAKHPNEFIIFATCVTLVRDRGNWHAL